LFGPVWSATHLSTGGLVMRTTHSARLILSSRDTRYLISWSENKMNSAPDSTMESIQKSWIAFAQAPTVAGRWAQKAFSIESKSYLAAAPGLQSVAAPVKSKDVEDPEAQSEMLI